MLYRIDTDSVAFSPQLTSPTRGGRSVGIDTESFVKYQI
jgi:hypothetical protein